MSLFPASFSDHTNMDAPDELTNYTVKEVADILKVHKSTVYLYIDRGELRTFRLGKSLRVRKQDLVEFIKDHL